MSEEVRYIKLSVAVAAIVCFLLPSQTSAAEVYFGAPGKEVGLGQTFEVGVFLNTFGQPVNAVGADIVIPADSFDITDIREGNSFLTLWVDHPKANNDRVTFSGAIPGGYNGNEAYLFSLILTAKKAGTAVISAQNDQILLNDGNGTAAPLTHAPLTLTILDTGVTETYVPPSDDVPPETFVPQIGQEPSLFENKYFVAFVTQDKQSGVAQYDVFESSRHYSDKTLLRKEGIEWQSANSPHVLTDQELHSYVYIRAVDRAGNIRIASIAPIHPLPWYEKSAIWGILLVGTSLVFGALLWFRFHMKRNKS